MVAANLNTGGFTPISRTSHDNSDLHIKAQCKQRGHQIQVFVKNVSLPLRSFVGSHFSKKSRRTLPTQFTGTLREDIETRVPRQVGRRQPTPLAGGAVLKGISFELGTTVPRAPLVSPQAPVSSLAAPRHHLRPQISTPAPAFTPSKAQTPGHTCSSSSSVTTPTTGIWRGLLNLIVLPGARAWAVAAASAVDMAVRRREGWGVSSCPTLCPQPRDCKRPRHREVKAA